jgi:hypothetical protein
VGPSLTGEAALVNAAAAQVIKTIARSAHEQDHEREAYLEAHEQLREHASGIASDGPRPADLVNANVK